MPEALQVTMWGNTCIPFARQKLLKHAAQAHSSLCFTIADPQKNSRSYKNLLLAAFRYMRLGAEAWYALCERLGAGGRGFTYNCPLPSSPLAFRPKPHTPVILDVVMADTNAVSTPMMAGQKRNREDEGEGEEGFVWDLEMRAEKVSSATRL